MKYIISIVLLLSITSCATLRTASGSLNWPVLVLDAQWGIVAACDSELFPKDECDIIKNSFDALLSALSNDMTKAAGYVSSALKVLEARIPATKPYLDWLIALT